MKDYIFRTLLPILFFVNMLLGGRPVFSETESEISFEEIRNVEALEDIRDIEGYEHYGETPLPQIVEVTPRAAVEHQGVPGFWFERSVALDMLADLSELPIRLREIQMLTEQLDIQDVRIERLDQMLALERSATIAATDGLQLVEERAREAEAALDSWWRSPAFLITVGVVSAILLEVAAVFVLTAVSP